MKKSGWLILILLGSCLNKDFVLPGELQEFVHNKANGCIQHTAVGNFEIEVVYHPIDLIIYQEVGGTEISKSDLEKMYKNYQPYSYFVLSLSGSEGEALNEVRNSDEYSLLLQTLSFDMTDYVFMTTSGHDTIQVADYALNRTFGTSISTDLMFVFKMDYAHETKWMEFNLNEFGLNTGSQSFRFDVKDLENTPHIKFALTP